MQLLFEYTDFKDDIIEYKCLCCNKNYQKFFFNISKSSDNDKDKFILLFQRGVYSYKHINDWETSLFEKEDFYSHLNM